MESTEYLQILHFIFFQAKDAEKVAIRAGIQENGSESSDKVVRAVLSERHAQEMRDLEKQFAAERKIMVDDAFNNLSEKYDQLREDMTQRHQKEFDALQVRLAMKNEGCVLNC